MRDWKPISIHHVLSCGEWEDNNSSCQSVQSLSHESKLMSLLFPIEAILIINGPVSCGRLQGLSLLSWCGMRAWHSHSASQLGWDRLIYRYSFWPCLEASAWLSTNDLKAQMHFHDNYLHTQERVVWLLSIMKLVYLCQPCHFCTLTEVWEMEVGEMLSIKCIDVILANGNG